MRAWRDARRALFVVPVLAAGLGLAGAAAIWSREASQARQRDMLAANQVATAVDRSAGIDLDGLRGANALVADDEQVSTARLNAFAEGLLKDSAILVVAHAIPVDDADRSAFEARLGTKIQEIADGGTYVAAARRPSYLPVVGAVAASPSINPVIGLDLLSDPDRQAAIGQATERDGPSISAPLALVPRGRVGYLAATPLRTPDGRIVGYVSAVFAIDDVLDNALSAIERRPKVAIYDHGERIVGSLEGGAAASVSIGGRTLVVRADDPSGANPWPAIAVAIGAVLVGIALAVMLHRLRRSERDASALSVRLQHDRAGAIRLAELGRMLTSSRNRADVVELVAHHAPAVVDADHAALAFVEGALLRTAPAHDGAVASDVSRASPRGSERFGSGRPLAPLDTHLPRTEAARDGRLVTVPDAAAYQLDHPDLLADVRADGIASVAAVPMLDATGATFGVLDLAWHQPRAFSDADEVRLMTLGALVAGTLQRVDAAHAEVRRSEQLAAFAERLSVAATAAEVREVVAVDAGALLGAEVVTCAVLDSGGGLDDPRDAGVPAAATAAVDRALAGEDVAGVADDQGRLVFAALALRAGQVVRGVMRVGWRTPTALDARAQATLRTVADLAAQALVRAQSTDASVRHADGLAKLAEELATATTLDQVASAAADYLPTISDAADVHVAVDGEADATGERHRLTDTSGDMVGELVVAWPAAATPDAEQQERLHAAIELIEDTVRRVDIQRSTSETLLSLRQRLMRPLPSPPGLDLAARYRPTSRPLGMGGDWYDVIERGDGTVAIVIGDVVGHGIPAIATMIHLSTILGGLVRSGTPLVELMGRTNAMLDGDGMVATAQVIVIDPDAAALSVVSAGHPPPLVRDPTGVVTALPTATHPPLGVPGRAGDVATVEFPAGAVVLGYTDGLVERRDESIDTSIDRLAQVLATTNGSMWGTVETVLSAMGRDADRGDDDVAIVVAQHRR
jgi:serine phosphatase RsbU (regulator of sigma subunit)